MAGGPGPAVQGPSNNSGTHEYFVFINGLDHFGSENNYLSINAKTN